MLSDRQRKGFAFEQALREILPWSVRPPLAVTGESEQIDAFFEWNSWHFLLETKAKEGKIQRGSHDWEDFELKIRKRNGSCIGLFCSLYEVAPTIVEAATQLNREGLCTIVLSGNFWNKLKKEDLNFDVLLRFLVLQARSTFKPCPARLEDIRNWYYDRQQTSRNLYSICRSKAARFLRRHKLPKHSDLYVEREMDKHLKSMAYELTPSQLMRLSKVKNTRGIEVNHQKDRPNQIFLFRDRSGAGKTTFSVNAALTQSNFIGLSRAALEEDIDDLDAILSRFGKNHGIEELIAIDRPLIYVIDSLDEVGNSANKRKEVISLIRFLDDLNEIAYRRSLRSFPLGLFFTVREEYWRDWETCFEGQRLRKRINRFSFFTQEELKLALDRYSEVYNFTPIGTLTTEGNRVLSIPFNMHIFSEANEYEAKCDLAEVFQENILGLYFARKAENIQKRAIAGLNTSSFFHLTAAIAMNCAIRQRNMVTRRELFEDITRANSLLIPVMDDIITVLRSEQLLQQDVDNPNEFRFRHTRLIEYLVAFNFVADVANTGSTENLGQLTEDIFESEFISMFRVHDFIRYISRTQYPEVLTVIETFYAGSEDFMTALVSHQRNSIAHGEGTSEDDLRLILMHSEASKPQVAWNSFFIICAKKNNQPTETLIEAFALAWSSNETSRERWKLIEKLGYKGLLLEEEVFARITGSENPKEWEVFLGFVESSSKSRELFKHLWEQTVRECLKEKMMGRIDEDWHVTIQLLKIVLNDLPYEPGQFG